MPKSEIPISLSKPFRSLQLMALKYHVATASISFAAPHNSELHGVLGGIRHMSLRKPSANKFRREGCELTHDIPNLSSNIFAGPTNARQ